MLLKLRRKFSDCFTHSDPHWILNHHVTALQGFTWYNIITAMLNTTTSGPFHHVWCDEEKKKKEEKKKRSLWLLCICSALLYFPYCGLNDPSSWQVRKQSKRRIKRDPLPRQAADWQRGKKYPWSFKEERNSKWGRRRERRAMWWEGGRGWTLLCVLGCYPAVNISFETKGRQCQRMSLSVLLVPAMSVFHISKP